MMSTLMAAASMALILVFASCSRVNNMVPTKLQCESDPNPLTVVEKEPLLSWQLGATERQTMQTSYRILVSDDPQLLEKNVGNMWDSRQVTSGQSLDVTYKGKKIISARTYYWKVKVWDNRKNSSDWSAIAHWHTGLFDSTDWKGAKWIGGIPLDRRLITVPAIAGENEPKWSGVKNILPLLRKSFIVRKPVKEAVAYVCGLGQFELSLNGQKVGDHFLDPAWTKFDKEAQYVGFDLTASLRTGSNAVGVMLGNGFYFVPGERYRKISGAFGNPTLLFQLSITYADGSKDYVVSDTSWKTNAGPVTFSSIYGGEDYDARLEQPGWDKALFDDSRWKKVERMPGAPLLVPQLADPLKYFDHFAPKKVTRPKPGVWIFDLGQNASGIPAISLRGKRGQTIKITPAELLDSQGFATQRSSGSPVYFRYTLKGEGMEKWQPRFMYYGFRYLQIEGATPDSAKKIFDAPTLLAVESIHIRNGASTTGHFSCSNTQFNKTFSLIDWAVRSNMVSIFTDCPHREKLGWLEEAHLVGPSIRYTYNISRLLRKVSRDMENAQTPEGLIPDIAPEYVQFEAGFRDSPEWGSSAILLPWYAYQWYGDRRLLERSYSMMTRYANYLESKSTGHLLDFGLGDWYDVGPNPPGESQLTPKGLTATAIYYYDLTILVKIAGLLGKPADAAVFRERGTAVKIAFNKKFFHQDTKQYGSGSQTANAMAIYMDLTDSTDRTQVLERLVADIRVRKNSLTTGDIGYRYLLLALAENGRSDIIFDLNSRSDVPGYGYQLAQGATSLTESWQAYPYESNNHLMLGQLMEWFYGRIGGIRISDTSVAFHTINISPEPVGDVTAATTSYDSPYGRIETIWKKNAVGFSLNVQIPPNTRANVSFPTNGGNLITESGKPLVGNEQFESFRVENGRAACTIGSGKYSFLTRQQ